jgi:hypothetical protein
MTMKAKARIIRPASNNVGVIAGQIVNVESDDENYRCWDVVEDNGKRDIMAGYLWTGPTWRETKGDDISFARLIAGTVEA